MRGVLRFGIGVVVGGGGHMVPGVELEDVVCRKEVPGAELERVAAFKVGSWVVGAVWWGLRRGAGW